MRKCDMIKHIKSRLEGISSTGEEMDLEDYYVFLENFHHVLFNNPPKELLSKTWKEQK